MRALLDTHVLLWWLGDAERLAPTARDLLADSTQPLLWSAASTWELGIKVALGKLRLPGSVERFTSGALEDQALIGLPIYHDHAARAAGLPPIHRDPFDRMLVAQALVERVPLVTADERLAAYGVECIPAK